MELKDYFRLLKRRWWLIALCALLGVSGAYVATERATPVYGSGLTFFLADAQGRPINALIADSAQTRYVSYATLLNSGPVITRVVQEAAVDAPLLNVQGAGVPETIFFSLSVRSSSPEAALAYASAYSKVLPEYISDFEGSTSGGTTLRVFEPPRLNLEQLSPDPQRNLLIGLALGLVLGVLTAVLLEALDSRTRTAEELEEETGLGLLAQIPYEHRGVDLVLRQQPRSQRAEALRQVRANLQFAAMESPIAVLLITSAVAGEGKTSVAADLALACAQAGERVVLVEADLRRPRLASVFKTGEGAGLTDVLAGTARLEEVLIPVEDNLRLLVAGQLPSRPSELLASQAMADVVARLAADCDLVVFDSAPVLPVADPVAMLPHVDAVILVNRIGVTSRSQASEAASRLRTFQARVIGVVANGGKRQESAYYAQARGTRRGAADVEPPALVPARSRIATGATGSHAGREVPVGGGPGPGSDSRPDGPAFTRSLAADDAAPPLPGEQPRSSS